MEKLLEHFKTKIRVSEDLKTALEKHFEYEKIEKDQYLLKEKQYCRRLYFLESGTVRTFYYDKGKDITSWFYRENQFFSSWYSFYNQEQSFEYIIAVENSSLYSIEYSNYQKLLQSFPKFERFGRLLAEEQTAFIDFYSKGYLFMSAKEKYDLLHTFFPDITMRVNLGHIASFLGITQETLSRIRRK